MTYSSSSVANAFIELANNEGKSLTNIHLQKLVFFAHGYTLAYLDIPLTFDKAKAWPFGPVYPDLYEQLRKYGRHPVSELINSGTSIDNSSGEMKVIRSVWNAYKDYSGFKLSDVSHNEGSPWSQVWKNDKFCEIPDSIVQKYYKGVI